ncbi:hypothetical protein Lal_00036763 [Lupinus albus]|uniref:Putative Calmodulin-binding domain, plant n=1 Tax=Lupinus albus TaxID=3870 RepID=A0A6A4PU86_LUPAL|nr:putative Calmodulin-binding domain, plant [Lupinus albus]KAF1888722.1 hypothetical protein Lal_00036763 [Lupinus albus]
MNVQTFDLPMASERVKFSDAQLRRHSTGEAFFGYNKENVISRYLKASSGSCHDSCKYGHKTEFEANEKHSTPRRASLHSKPMKMPVVDRRMSIDSKLPITSTETNGMELPTKSPDSKKQRGKEVMVNKNNASLVKSKPLFLSKPNVSSITKTTTSHDISSMFEVKTQSKTISKNKETISKSTSDRVKTTSKSTFEVKAMDLSKKSVIFLNPKSVALKTIPSKDSSKSIGAERSTKIKMEKKEGSRELVSPSRALLSSKPSLKINARNHNGLKIVPGLKNEPEPRRVEPKKLDDEVEEKTLYVINVESDNQTSQSDRNGSQDIEPLPEFSSSVSESTSKSGQEKSEYSTSEFEEDSTSRNREAEYTDNKDSLKVEDKGNPQKSETVFLEYKECQMLKLKMVRGKLVETQFEKISPKKLKFRPGKELQENATNVNIDANNIGDITDSEKVNLIELEGKKDEQRLLNNVVEVTASKLVKFQKGKVKALVNAFEAIIFLQEQKSLTNIVSLSG